MSETEKSASTSMCPVVGCDQPLVEGGIMCQEDWERLPSLLKRRIWLLKHNEPGMPRYVKACDEAIRLASVTRNQDGGAA